MSTNRFRGIVEIELDKPRRLRYTLGCLIALEESCGIFLTELEGAKKSPRLLRDLLWAGLIDEDPGLTREAVGGLVGMAELAGIWNAVTRALGAGLGELTRPDPSGPPQAAGGENPPIETGEVKIRGRGKKRSS
jgi:hypothetical protein